jgi:hypothetical protein
MLSKKHIKLLFENKIKQRLSNAKKAIAKSYIIEADLDPEAELKVIKTRLPGGVYRYQFTMGKVYIVDLVPSEQSNSIFGATFYVKGQDKATSPNQRYGVANVNLIPVLIENVLKCVDMFLEVKKPMEIRFLPGEEAAFPMVYHQHIFKGLKNFKSAFDKQYALIRGDAKKDGAAFVLKRSAAADNIKTAGWKPSKTSSGETIATKEIGQSEIAI